MSAVGEVSGGGKFPVAALPSAVRSPYGSSAEVYSEVMHSRFVEILRHAGVRTRIVQTPELMHASFTCRVVSLVRRRLVHSFTPSDLAANILSH